MVADLTLDNWTPVDITGAGTMNMAAFNGGGHTVTIRSFDISAATRLGLFGTATNAKIHDLNLDLDVNQSIPASTTQYSVGGIAGYASAAAIGLVRVSGTLNITVNSSNNLFLGGIVGDLTSPNSLVDSSSSSLAITGENTGGGVASVGGIAGAVFNGAAVTNSGNTGFVISSHRAGGIAGIAQGQAANPVLITDCYNKGTINGDDYAGGLAASGQGVLIKLSFSSAVVQGGSFAGGIIGRLTDTTGSGPSSIGYCYSAGEIRSNGNSFGAAGGITSEFNSTHTGSAITIILENLYSSASVFVTGTAPAGGLFGMIDMSSSTTVNVNLIDSYALNPVVEHIGTGATRGRVVGNTSGTVNLSNLHALSTMKIGHRDSLEDTLSEDNPLVPPPDDSTTQGADFSLPTSAEIDVAYPSFDSDVWTIDPAYSPYPVFQWQVAAGVRP
ncbi:hypothetical protein AGMMS50293_10170 [Spirochaetia bacterium]|nr:hypothetical protein AGMMS50293_10170 [Spirochaetia bacterium]